jgi:hypothetical protein
VSAAIYQGANALEEEEFHQGNMSISDYAYSSLRGQSAVNNYQELLTRITTDIVTLEILTHTPILTNTTTEITLDSGIRKSSKQIKKENKQVEKEIKAATKEEIKKEKAFWKSEQQREKKEKRETESAAKQSAGDK